jgi:hypothetical protein
MECLLASPKQDIHQDQAVPQAQQAVHSTTFQALLQEPRPHTLVDTLCGRDLLSGQVDVLPLERFNVVWRPNEPERLEPVFVERVTIREALRGDLLRNLFRSVQLVEPTFGVSPKEVTAAAMA